MNTQKLLSEYQALIDFASGESEARNVRKIRDLSIIKLIGGISLVIACDSNASNGEKPDDFHKNSYEEVAVSALKVPLMEVLASGATPVIIADNLCVEMDGAGARIISVMQDELERCGLAESVQLTGSTEDNMKTIQTGIGVTVVGLVTEDKFKIGKTQQNDIIVCVGKPQSGIDSFYSERDNDVAKIETVNILRNIDYIHEILPIGSKGAAYECSEMARISGFHFERSSECEINLETSAGSATAVLISLKRDDLDKLKSDVSTPFYEIGEMN